MDITRRLQKATQAGVYASTKQLDDLVDSLFDADRKDMFLADVEELSDEHGKVDNTSSWKLLCNELGEAAKLQATLTECDDDKEDFFERYADLYDAVIGRPCLDAFMANDIEHFQSKYSIDLADKTILSVGCGTGLVERHMLETLNVPRKNLFGIDISEGMINVASQRIRAEVGDLLALDPEEGLWDIAYHGLNVFQYLDHHYFEQSVRKVASVLKPGGWFLGDFITSDHIRWYPNVMVSEGNDVVSLRTPQLVEKENCVYQRARIINVSFHDKMRISDEGSYERFLPPIGRVRHYFERNFKGPIDIYDAVSLAPISPHSDTCASTRYLVCARN